MTPAAVIIGARSWVHDHVGAGVHVGSLSGGTDVCTAFVGPCPLLPVHAGEIQCRCLGAKVEAYDEEGHPLIGQRGELVLTAPMPSMPVRFWNDPNGTRYREAYFGHYPGVWQHGDWIEITDRGSCIITGRSDATLNRGGVRIGTAEIYSVVESLPAVADCLVVHREEPTSGGEVVLFVVPAAGFALDARLVRALADVLRRELSPRHVPDRIVQVSQVPRTISGKKMELPVKRLLAGEPPDRVVNPGAMVNPESLGVFVELARKLGPTGASERASAPAGP